MKLFYVGPNVDNAMDEALVKARTLSAVEPIADLILSYFRLDGFQVLFGLSCLNPPCVEDLPVSQPRPAYPTMGLGQERFGRYVVTRFQSEDEVRTVLINRGNCYARPSKGPLAEIYEVRSLLSCRSVNYGYDGQAFLCLHAEDAPPTTPDSEIILIEERPDLLLNTDYMDGVVAPEDW